MTQASLIRIGYCGDGNNLSRAVPNMPDRGMTNRTGLSGATTIATSNDTGVTKPVKGNPVPAVRDVSLISAVYRRIHSLTLVS